MGEVHMERLPLELWEKIGKHACVDGGRTGCSLSLVSRGVKHATQTVRYTSVMIVNEKSCFAFASLLSQTTSYCFIAHLFISYYRAAHFSPTPSKPLSDVEEACLQILRRAAPNLVTLSLHDSALFKASNAKVLFPILRDLFIPSLCRYRYLEPYALMFPNLQRLHTLQSDSDLSLDFWEDLATIAPTVAEIVLAQLSGVESLPFLSILMNVPVAQFDRLLSNSEAGYTPESQEASRAVAIATKLSCLTKIWARSETPEDPYGEVYRCGNSDLVYEDVQDAVRTIENSTKERGGVPQLRVLNALGRYNRVQAKADWLDVVGGGVGPWCDHADSR